MTRICLKMQEIYRQKISKSKNLLNRIVFRLFCMGNKKSPIKGLFLLFLIDETGR